MTPQPRRALVDDEPTDVTTGDAVGPMRSAGMRPGVGTLAKKYALPGVLVASITAGVLGVVLTPQRAETITANAAAPAAELEARDAGTSRDLERPALDATPTPEATPTPDVPEIAPVLPVAPAAPGAVEPAPVAPAAPAPAPSSSAPSATGVRYATESLNVRSAPSASADRIATLAKGDKVSVTDTTSDDFQQVLVEGRAGWASSDYLAKTAPTATPSAPSASPSADAPVASGACAPLPGVKPNTEKVHQAICAKWGSKVSSYIGVRPDRDVEHPSGRAVDALISSNSIGWEIANYVRVNASSLGVAEVIFDQKIWTTQRSSEGWRAMSDRGSVTANHRDHVHVSTR